jgi:hypothetical protein
LKSILLEEISDKDPEHWKFHKFLDRVVKKKQNVSKDDESCKLMLCDLKNIVGAWTAYVEAKKLLLPTMAQYRDMVIKTYPNQGFKAGAGGHTQARRDEFASWKKEWMLKVRRRDHVWAREQAEAKAGLARRRARPLLLAMISLRLKTSWAVEGMMLTWTISPPLHDILGRATLL